MEQLLTSNIATNLYWFGRHLERVEAVLVESMIVFDKIIDHDPLAGKRFFEPLEIEVDYEHASSFLNNTIFGDHASNLVDIMSYARENAIICRTQINTDAFGETIRLHQHFDRAAKTGEVVDYRFVCEALSLVNEIWGTTLRGLSQHKSDYFIRLGKLIERVDLHLRYGKNDESIKYLHDILMIARQIAPDAHLEISETDEEANLDAINGLIHCLIVTE